MRQPLFPSSQRSWTSQRRSEQISRSGGPASGHEACCCHFIVGLLIDNGADANAKDEKGWTLLHWAVDGDRGAVQLLLEAGADANAKDNDEQTPLHGAAVGGHLDLVALLSGKE